MNKEWEMRKLLKEYRLLMGQVLSWAQQNMEGDERAGTFAIAELTSFCERMDRQMKEIDKPNVAYVGR